MPDVSNQRKAQKRQDGRPVRAERWPFDTAVAIAAVSGDIGVVELRGLANAQVLQALHERIALWVERQRLTGFVLKLGWTVVLTARGEAELIACAQPGVGALLVPPERLQWANKLCRQLAARWPTTVFRTAFCDEIELAARWVRVVSTTLSKGVRHV